MPLKMTHVARETHILNEFTVWKSNYYYVTKWFFFFGNFLNQNFVAPCSYFNYSSHRALKPKMISNT